MFRLVGAVTLKQPFALLVLFLLNDVQQVVVKIIQLDILLLDFGQDLFAPGFDVDAFLMKFADLSSGVVQSSCFALA